MLPLRLILSSILAVGLAGCGAAGSPPEPPATAVPTADASTHSPRPTVDAGTAGDAAPPPRTDAEAGSACALGVTVSRARFVDESIAYLRAAFGAPGGFDSGKVVYGEMWVSLDSGAPCPLADWSTLSYVVAIDPSRVPIELRGTHRVVAVFWGLNGRRDISLLRTQQVTPQDPAPWQAGALPENVNAIAAESASDGALNAFVAALKPAHPNVAVDYLSAIRILTLSTNLGDFANAPQTPAGTFPQIEAAIQQARASNLFSTIEWSALNFAMPYELWPGTIVGGDLLEPECLRAHTKSMRDTQKFTTVPSLAKPLGQGEVGNPKACL
jgi:hypothetical protein